MGYEEFFDWLVEEAYAWLWRLGILEVDGEDE